MPPGVHQATVRGGAETVRDPAAAVVAGASTTSGKWEAPATLAAFCPCRVRMCPRAPVSPRVPPATPRRGGRRCHRRTQSLPSRSVAASMPRFPLPPLRAGSPHGARLSRRILPAASACSCLDERSSPVCCRVVLKAVCSMLECGRVVACLRPANPPCRVGFHIPSEGFCFNFPAGTLYIPSCAVCILDVLFFLFNLVLSYPFQCW